MGQTAIVLSLTASNSSTVFSKMRSVSINLLVRGPWRFHRSFSTHEHVVEVVDLIMIESANDTAVNWQTLLDIQIQAPIGLGEVRVDICKAKTGYHGSDGLRANRRTNNTIVLAPAVSYQHSIPGGSLSRAC